MAIAGGTHELIDSKAAAKNPFSLEVHEIILSLLIRGPTWRAPVRLECGQSISEFYTLHFECSDSFCSIWTSWRLGDFSEERGKDCLGIEWYAFGMGGIWLGHHQWRWSREVGRLTVGLGGVGGYLDVYVVWERSTEVRKCDTYHFRR